MQPIDTLAPHDRAWSIIRSMPESRRPMSRNADGAPDPGVDRERPDTEERVVLLRADRVVEDADARHGQALLGLALRSGLTRDAAEDAVQEALLRLWQELRRGVDVIEPRAWLFQTVYRLAMDEHRLRRRVSELVTRLSQRSWRTLDADAAREISVWQLVDRLPMRQRQVLYLRYKADMSFDQVGAVMGIAASTARAHAAFATERLRSTIDPTWDP
jgi:RNA polymerase sigma factor (sigma-70 family)